MLEGHLALLTSALPVACAGTLPPSAVAASLNASMDFAKSLDVANVATMQPPTQPPSQPDTDSRIEAA